MKVSKHKITCFPTVYDGIKGHKENNSYGSAQGYLLCNCIYCFIEISVFFMEKIYVVQ